MSDDRPDAPDRIAEYVRTHPDASPVEVLGVLELSPEWREYVADALAGETPTEPGPEGGSPGSDPTPSTGETPSSTPDTDGPLEDGETVGSWFDADFSVTVPDTYPSELLEREQWMGRAGESGKLPFAPWGDENAPAECSREGHTAADKCDCDARWKWGYSGHYVTGEAFEMFLEDPKYRREIDGRVFIQRESDPHAFVDGDDVRDPETGDVHPAFLAILEQLGLTYADVSTSGEGAHAYYTGELPIDGEGQATFDIDTEPWGANDSVPTVEIYANKHVNVATGDHVAGTPHDVNEWDADALRAILQANGYEDKEQVSHDTDADRPNLEDYEPTATGGEETTDEIRDVLKAVDRLGPSDLPLRTRRTGEDSTGWTTWNPAYRSSESGESLHYTDGVFFDHKEGEGFGVLGLFAAEQGIIRDPWGRLEGSDWFDAVDAARDAGAPIPEYEQGSAGEPVTAIPFAKLDALTGSERERYARKRGLEIPATDEARDRLRDALFREIRAGNRTVLDAPTALGKSHTTATTPWLNHADVTGEAPVVHLHATTDARDEAAKATRQTPGVSGAVLKGRKERCPVARGDHDPVEDPDAEDAPDVIVTIDGTPASEWFDRMCDGKGLPFSTAHAIAREHNDQGLEDLPCSEDSECPAVSQWDGLPRNDDGEATVDVIHATHQFAHVPSLRRHTNVVLDEQPDFTADLEQDRIRCMVTAYLKEIGAPVTTFEAFVTLAKHDGYGGDAAAERDALEDRIGRDPTQDWYVSDPDAHALAPDLTKAIWNALTFEDPDANGRRSTTVLHEPPRLDADGDEGYAGTWLSVVLDEDNTVRTVRTTPNFSQARAVVGLDAHPSMPMWHLNTDPDMRRDAVLDPTERQLWRRYERGLTVVQVGDATRPRSGKNAREWMNDERVRTLLESLREQYGGGFKTAIAPVQVEPAVRRLLEDTAGDADTMHQGEEKSRNDFGDEQAGYVYGCMDPGDDMILDALAELGLEATPGTVETEDGEIKREKGRTFDGPDADTAEAVLASVRENHTAQSAGRYARNPDDPDSRATVYVHTDAAPSGFVDLEVPGVEWLATDLQREILETLTDRPRATTKEIADAADCSKEHVRQTLGRLEENDLVERDDGAGDYGADLYQSDAPTDALVDLGETTNDGLYGSNRWSLAIVEREQWSDGSSHATPDVRTGSTPADGDGPPPTGLE